MKRFAIYCLFTGLLVAASALCHAPQAAEAYRAFALDLLASAPGDVRFRADLEERLNARASGARVDNDRGQLEANVRLRDAARAQALEMLLGNYVGHESASGFSFEKRFQAFGGHDVRLYGENAARATGSAAAEEEKADLVFRQWLDSTGHRRNLMQRDYTYVATGVAQRGDAIYAVQIYWQKEIPPQGLDALVQPEPGGGVEEGTGIER